MNRPDFQVNLKVVPLESLPSHELKELGKLKPYRFLLDYCFDLVVIALAIVISEYYFFNGAIYLVAVVVIGSRINALSVLMHETAHFRGFRSKKLNYVFGELVGWVLLATMEGYRRKHIPHHTSLNTLDDPDWVRKIPNPAYHYPKTPKGFIYDSLRQISGLGYIDLAKEMLKSKELKSIPAKLKWFRALFYVAVLSACAYTHTLDKLALYWFIPLVTVFNYVLWLRSLSEHYGNLGYDHPYNYSRTTLVKPLEAFILSPHNINYHIEHHLYPNVPYYNLGKLHKLLMQRPIFREHAHITQGIVKGLFKEILAKQHGPTFAEMAAIQRDLQRA